LAQGSIDDVISPVKAVINAAGPILLSLAFLAFLWGLVKYIASAGDPKKASEGKSIMIYGAIALFVMSSIWGITTFIGDIFGISAQDAPTSDIIPGLNE